jgi:hypothetical protein
MSSFCKNENCPPSETLLAFQLGEIEVKDGAAIRRHLCVCEFCAAEVEFYGHYPQGDEEPGPVEAGEIPQPLLELAEALLANKSDVTPLYRLIDYSD